MKSVFVSDSRRFTLRSSCFVYCFALFVLFILLPGMVAAQFNDTINYYFKINSAGIVNRTNDRNAYVLNNQVRFSFYRKNVSVNTNNSWIYGKQQGALSNRDFTSALDFDLYKSRHNVYYWGLLHYESSFSLKLDHRFQGGAGIGYYLIDRKDFVVHISEGILYEMTDLYDRENAADNVYDTYRNSFRLKFRFLFHERLSLEGSNFLQHAIGDRKDYIIRSNTMLTVKLWKFVSLTVNVNYNKLNLTERENFLLNYGVLLEKYF